MMENSGFRLSSWAAGLMLASLPLIGLALAPSSLADITGPCAFDAASMACLEWTTGGASAVCGLNPGSMGCLEADTAARADASATP